MQTWQKLKNNPNLWQKFFVREKIIQAIREFFIKRNFHEVETPLLLPSLIPESYLEVFETYLLDRQKKTRRMFLTTSPEASLKKLLIAGIGNCFEISKSFRNTETGSRLHNPEFTILEWYRVNADYQDIMRDCEKLFSFILKYLKLPKTTLVYQGQKIDLSAPWERISVAEAFKKYAHMDIIDCLKIKNILREANLKGYNVDRNNSWEETFNQIFLNEVEPKLAKQNKPVILYDYPRPLAALARLKPSNPALAERFEFYIGGLELGNGYTELTDYKEQQRRFKEELRLRKLKDKTTVIPDLDFLKASKVGLPPCAGIAVGVDRLVMLFTDSLEISQTLTFPLKDLLYN